MASAESSSPIANTQAAAADAVLQDTNALNLRWSFGFNSVVRGSVHNLSTAKRKALLYVSSHTGVIHDIQYDTQYLLQGHCNPIVAVCVSKDKRWIATADSGEKSMIVVWDARKGVPVKIISQPYPNGIAAMDISTDAMYLVTLSQPSASSPSSQQELAIWEWTRDTSDLKPTASASIGDSEYQHCVRFNPIDVRDVVSNGRKKVIFWNWSGNTLTAFHPPRGTSKLKTHLGALTQTCFIPYTTKAVTATQSGHVVLWNYPISDLVESSGRDAIKIVKVSSSSGSDSGINLIDTVIDKFIVTGGVDGSIRFFDFQFRVVGWFEDVEAGEVTSLSFAQNMTTKPTDSFNTSGESVSTFNVPDFVCATALGKIIALNSRMMDNISKNKRRGTLLVEGFDGNVNALDAHPCLSLFSVGTSNGTLQVWDVDERAISFSRHFKSLSIQCLKYSPRGDLLVVGFTNGTVKVLRAREPRDTDANFGDDDGGSGGGRKASYTPLSDIRSFRHSTDAITHIAFSPCGQYFAVAAANSCVCLFRYYHRDEETDRPVEWIYIGKHRSHYKPIVDLYFTLGRSGFTNSSSGGGNNLTGSSGGANGNDGLDDDLDSINGDDSSANSNPAPILYSLGQDRVLQEYDITASTIKSGVRLRNSIKVDQLATSTAFVAIPGTQGRRRQYEHMAQNLSSIATSSKNGNNNSNSNNSNNKSNSNTNSMMGPAAASDQGIGQLGGLFDADMIVTVNDEYKMKVWESSSTELENGNGGDHDNIEFPRLPCRQTLLSPTYGGPISKMLVLPERRGRDILLSQYLVYGTFEKVVGMIKLPLDGNPSKSMALIAHPGEISNIVSSFDGKYLITAGGADRSVNLWQVSVSAFEASIAVGGGNGSGASSDIEPFMRLIEGGRDGAFYQELVDYFYYAQLRVQGVGTTAPRRITGYISIEEAINLMRALGYYPTQQEVEDMVMEVRGMPCVDGDGSDDDGYDDEQQSGRRRVKERITLDEFIRLYVNYRPVFGMDMSQFSHAFSVLAKHAHKQAAEAEADGDDASAVSLAGNADTDGNGQSTPSLSKEQFVSLLRSLGEQLTPEELDQCFDVLLGADASAEFARPLNKQRPVVGGLRSIEAQRAMRAKASAQTKAAALAATAAATAASGAGFGAAQNLDILDVAGTSGDGGDGDDAEQEEEEEEEEESAEDVMRRQREAEDAQVEEWLADKTRCKVPDVITPDVFVTNILGFNESK